MLRKCALLSLLILLLICLVSSWAAIQQTNTLFIAVGATNIHINELRPGERLISYMATNPNDSWQTQIGQRLNANGWNLEVDPHQWGGTETITTLASYVRVTHFWRFTLRERAEFTGDRRTAHIKVTYTVLQNP